MKNVAIKDIITFLQSGNFRFEFTGCENTVITGFKNISEINDNCIAWVKNKKYFTETVQNSFVRHPSAVIVAPWKIAGISNCLITDSPKELFFSVLNKFFKERRNSGISKRAVVETDKVGCDVSIGAGCYICEDVEIGDDVVIHANVVIDCPCKIGKGTEIFAGTVIGADGFGYYHHNEIPERVPHFGRVIIGDYVDIGANTCIDRGCLGDTVIGNHVKIDNLCHVGHNVQIGNNTMIVAGTTVCGSAVIGDDSYIAPEAVIKNQVSIGEKSFVGMNTVLNKDVNRMTMAIDSKQTAQILKNMDYKSFL